MTPRKPSGFTLIELLIVIAIIGVLSVALLPRIIGSRENANKTANEANMKWHFQVFIEYEMAYKTYGREGGHKFVLDPWVRGKVEKTDASRDRYFNPNLLGDPYYQELKAKDSSKLWPNLESLTSQDTHYAGRAKEHLVSMKKGDQAWMADDNETGPAFSDNTIVVLMGDGSIKRLEAEDLKATGWDPDSGQVFEVGPQSPLPLLQRLQR